MLMRLGWDTRERETDTIKVRDHNFISIYAGSQLILLSQSPTLQILADTISPQK